MSELSELERRLSEALDRIREGVERLTLAPLPAAPSEAAADEARGAAEEIASLREALEAERLANAQLEERLAAIRSRLEEKVEELSGEVEGLREQLEATHARNRHLKRRLEEVRAALARLREAASEGVTEPEQINRAMLAELESLRALREADRHELDALIAELKPLVEEAADA
ncbi:hypothetical protein SAMN05216257_103241 [Meinhardsimonia xiamenensis]|jgi:chromosome segregation ATPase|uniref:Uncharacterized protein n=1 Tax=Meinhardsimonia xiamenensis TaxID=990712 RepID=A0A1G9CV89_9RHOB|nr:hypothetical protein [Meinhardsimonia xiamenensis]PRX38233.1 hypothetical protein LV81_00513 [Meinhardsimonia xiamenensis]SDK55547.1 hypothetical protein SAMN05216257_103241 [Meinhardsimonia xiamenensis]